MLMCLIIATFTLSMRVFRGVKWPTSNSIQCILYWKRSSSTTEHYQRKPHKNLTFIACYFVSFVGRIKDVGCTHTDRQTDLDRLNYLKGGFTIASSLPRATFEPTNKRLVRDAIFGPAQIWGKVMNVGVKNRRHRDER